MENSGFIVSELDKRGLRDLGKDFVVQALTCLGATGVSGVFAGELSKLNSIRNKIEVELSLAPRK